MLVLFLPLPPRRLLLFRCASEKTATGKRGQTTRLRVAAALFFRSGEGKDVRRYQIRYALQIIAVSGETRSDAAHPFPIDILAMSSLLSQLIGAFDRPTIEYRR